MKRTFKKIIENGLEDLPSLFRLCQIALDEKMWDSAIERAHFALDKVPMQIYPLHVDAVKFHVVLMQAYFMKGEMTFAELAFSKTLAILSHHWGPHHPYQITIYGVLANLMMSLNRMMDARFLLTSSLTCC